MSCTSHLPEAGRIVTLIDGRDVCSCSEAFRHECECRWALETMDLRQRREYLARVQSKRGEADRRRMEETLSALWAARKAA